MTPPKEKEILSQFTKRLFLRLRQPQPNGNYPQNTGFSAKCSDNAAILYTTEDHLHSLFTYEGSSSDGRREKSDLMLSSWGTQGQQRVSRGSATSSMM